MKVSNTVKEYFAALEHLRQNVPKHVPKGGPINKDSVAMEAGRKRGSIRNRPGFEALIAEIEAAGEKPLYVTPLFECRNGQSHSPPRWRSSQIRRGGRYNSRP